MFTARDDKDDGFVGLSKKKEAFPITFLVRWFMMFALVIQHGHEKRRGEANFETLQFFEIENYFFLYFFMNCQQYFINIQ
jgi:hypothetical protein